MLTKKELVELMDFIAWERHRLEYDDGADPDQDDLAETAWKIVWNYTFGPTYRIFLD